MSPTTRLFPGAALFAALLALFSSPPAARAQAADIVLHASDVSVVRGNWVRLPSTTGAGGEKMTSEDRGWATPNAPLASPSDYFEATFQAPAGIAYRVWLRLRAAGNSKYNESVWLQFSNAVTSAGAPLWPIASASALAVNLENCSGCGVSGWGWQDNAYWLSDSSVVRFAASGSHTIRVQTREDGVDVDQIVLSPVTYFSAAPGGLSNDATIVPKGGSPGIAILRGPYLQQVGHDRAVVVWTTREPGPAEARYGQNGTGSTAAARTRHFPASATGLSYDFYQHEARLGGLAASSIYTYDLLVGGIDAMPSTSAFRTAPPPASGSATFLAFGDSGVGSTAQRQLSDRMAAAAFDFAVHTGDVVYGYSTGNGPASYRQYDQWFFGVYAPWLRSRPAFPSLGNHDDEIGAGQAYRDVFVLPAHGATSVYPDHAERYYSFDYGPVHVTVLDTETAFQDPARRAAQLEWLDADLAATPQPWKVAVLHRPPYSSGAHGSDLAVRAAFAPVFERRGVRLVLASHDHHYERTRPLLEHAPGGTAVTYVVTGGGGAPLYAVGTSSWTAASASVHHYVKVSAGTGCSMSVQAVDVGGGTVDQFAIDRCSATPSPPPSPSLAVPGTIEAENFDQGADGTAYRDDTAGNSGGQYRATDVDIERSAEGGYNVGWIGAGEWLRYTVNVQAAGTYVMEARVASPGGGSFHVEFGGADKTGPIAVPATGAWQSWRNVSRTVTLGAGVQAMRLVFDTAGYNVNYVRLAPQPSSSASTPYGGTPRTIPGRIESEDFDEGGEGIAYHDSSAVNSGGQYRSTGVDVERTGDAGGGFDVGWAGAGEWLNYTVNVAAAGTYTLVARVASPGTGGTFHVELNGVNVTGPLRVPATGGWQVYTDVTVRIAASAGRQGLRVVMDTNGANHAVGNFNYLAVF